MQRCVSVVLATWTALFSLGMPPSFAASDNIRSLRQEVIVKFVEGSELHQLTLSAMGVNSAPCASSLAELSRSLSEGYGESVKAIRVTSGKEVIVRIAEPASTDSDADQQTARFIATLKQRADVEYAQPNFLLQPSGTLTQ